MRGETIVCIATRMWDSMWREAQQHMSRMAVDNRVVYVEPGRNPDRPHLPEMRRNARHFLRIEARRVAPNLTVVPSPSCLPYARRHLPGPILRAATPAVASVNAWILIRHVRRALAALRVERPILWLYDPRQIDLIGRFGEKLACYYIYDEFADYADNAGISALLRRYDQRMIGRADVTFACSPWIYERRRAISDRVYLTPNAVDFDAFHRALDLGLPLPAELAALPRPILGVAGMLDDRVDVELLLRIAETYPRASLVLVGPDRLPAREATRRLRATTNVSFLGQKDPRALPAYVAGFDVALIPYVVARHTLPLYPLKLFEYLATGRSVVASALPEMRRFGGVARVAESADAFVEQVGLAIGDDAPERVAARLAVARENTWDARIRDMYRILQAQLVERERVAS